MRHLKSLLEADTVGKVFRARITMVSGHEVFTSEPILTTRCQAARRD